MKSQEAVPEYRGGGNLEGSISETSSLTGVPRSSQRDAGEYELAHCQCVGPALTLCSAKSSTTARRVCNNR